LWARHALDVVGERWTLLIVRELMADRRRSKDLLNGLPGISANLLAERLKGLEQRGITGRHFQGRSDEIYGWLLVQAERDSDVSSGASL
jgi:DNA-binding HxlR family transcriptional regulator